jgi:hypothetical protein
MYFLSKHTGPRPGVIRMPPPGNVPATLTLEDLAEDFPHIPPECGTVLVQSAILCLEGQSHKSGVPLTVQGSFDAAFRLLWSMDVTEAMRRYWGDPDEAAEQGAYALALLLLRALTGLTVLERLRKGTGLTGGWPRKTISSRPPPGWKSRVSCAGARDGSTGG